HRRGRRALHRVAPRRRRNAAPRRGRRRAASRRDAPSARVLEALNSRRLPMADSDKVPFPNLAEGDDMPAALAAPGAAEPTPRGAVDLEAVFDVPVQVSAVLGRAHMDVGELLNLGPGTVLELDRKVGEAIDIYVNNRLVARGEVVLVEDKLGVTMTEIIKADHN